MHAFKTASAARTAAVIAFVGAAATLSSQGAVAGTMKKHASAKPASAAQAVSKLVAATPTTVRALGKAASSVAAVTPRNLGGKIRWVPVRHGAKTLRTLAPDSRLLLARSAAERAGLASVGLSFQDVYGVIDAETDWVPRDGMGKNGVTSLGLAQFEPATAKGLGLQDPHDPVQAVHAAAVYMKHGAEWAARKIAHLKLSPEQRAAKLREGVSIYYNLSVRGRNKWDGFNTAQLPVETRRHISNVRSGAQEALQLAGQSAA
jgi:soluble lytic murein transglycosylase-like protein